MSVSRTPFDLHFDKKMSIVEGFAGGIAQLGERLHGMQEVSGSIPLTSTSETCLIGVASFDALVKQAGHRSPVRLEA